LTGGEVICIAFAEPPSPDPEGVRIVDGVFAWLKLSGLTSPSELVPQFVSAGGVETFQIGHREFDFRMDAFAFVTAGETPTSLQLSNAVVPVPVPEPGTQR